jgi:hypothetical protein
MKRRVNVGAKLRRLGRARRRIGRRIVKGAITYGDFLDEYPNQRNFLVRERRRN